MRIAQLTNEYPPHVYGGAGVHIEYLSRELARAEGGAHQVQVLSFGDQRVDEGNLRVHGVAPDVKLAAQDPRHARLLDALVRDLAMVGLAEAPEIVHCHTWYAHLAGCLARPLTGARLVLTTHSLEPHRPWKVEQLGTAYDVTTWIERTAYQNADGVVAVSRAMKEDVQTLYGVHPDRVRVIHNGIDPDEYRPRLDPDRVRALGVDPDQPIVLFVGRITRQKGILHLVRALRHLRPGVQAVLCAGAPDTPEIGAEMQALVEDARHDSAAKIVWLAEMLPREDTILLYSHADVFVCPSVYEPFGIINLEAMACETPVVASAVGGIPEIVVPGETGLLVPIQPEGGGSVEPREPEAFSRALADAVNELLDAPDRRAQMGRAARARVLEHFSWRAIAEQTLAFYRDLLAAPRPD
ncbi:glycogen synthase [Longimicrobium sp.]|uniref:glycogen synthase n=1 Tax=Longimicrobium sp. TaxID=2029185 RepID=UPI002E33E39A|nr:glycogen synthase [Longimicrobium sp.]HEX6037328.1 glycogen synthase [Longimicrobium sp.]